jgi:hypothetical protein
LSKFPPLTMNHNCILNLLLADPVLSCSEGADPSKVDTCCTETFGGLVVRTTIQTCDSAQEILSAIAKQTGFTASNPVLGHSNWPREPGTAAPSLYLDHSRSLAWYG